MSKFVSKLLNAFSSRTLTGVDKHGNRYFTRNEQIDGIAKEKRWVVFKGEEDSTSIPVEWISWLNGQRKRAPTPEEIAQMEARRELVRQNVALLKQKEEEEKRSGVRKSKTIGKSSSPDLKSFMQQFPEVSVDQSRESEELSGKNDVAKKKEGHAEPSGSGSTFKPGTWQPPM